MRNLLRSVFLILLPCLAMSQGFTTNNVNGNLIDACGNNFVMKGMNVPLAWYVNDVNGSITALKNNTKSNCLRIVVQTNTSDNAWQTTVVNCIKNKIIPMVELHDVTGSTDAGALKTMGDFWASKASFFNNTNFNGVNIKKHILINLANEWGTWQTASNKNTMWRDAVINAIKPMRDAGISTTIVIDAVGYGQDIDDAYNLRTYGKDIQRADNVYLGGPSNSTQKANLLFSIHMYCEWKKGGDNIGIVNTIKSSGVPVIVGEFGYQHASDGSCDIDEQTILNTCQAGGVGWLAWSQKGNGGGVEYLDLCNDWACTNLSAWGNTIINGTNGTKTAVECSVFSNPNCTSSCKTAAPVVIPSRVYCHNDVATALSATGTDLKWYTDATSGSSSTTAPFPNTAIVGSSTYYVSQTLNGCEGPRASISVNVNALPIIESYMSVNGGSWEAQGSATLCEGGSLTIGPHPYDVSVGWSWTGPDNFTSSVREISFKDIKPAQSGTYKVSYSDANNCSNSLSIPVTVQEKPAITFTSPSDNSVITSNPADILIEVSVSGNNISNVQFMNGVNLLGQDATVPYNFNWKNVDNGSYTITAKAIDAINCSNSKSINVTVNNVITSLKGPSDIDRTLCYPNPFHHQLVISPYAELEFIIMDAIGNIQERGITTHEFHVGESLPAGIYFLKVNNNMEEKVINIIKE
ncbi:cellulase family glycosylhydrolase [Sporocytophaga myxococcoides]|uniref:cellulase family glycosylhydrolase n=1 Tax=Sporocytophaga myxococcoides TaxID=153721 RepID=UPI000409EA9D|nr:cellulase family glycosylhydrolase [Sporocytophaga myxococcoides]